MSMSKKLFGGLAVAVALSLAAGPTWAAPVITKKVVKKIANREITRRAHTFRGPTGPVGPLGPVGPIGPAGTAAVQFYASILKDGFVVPSRSFGITQANVFVDGTTYCITGIPFNNGAQVTPNYFQTTSDAVVMFGQGGPAGCESFVKTVNGAGVEVAGGFFIILY
ncbi:hypothetical protein BH20PSE1_BH20PSE1_08500 [soil metagenome]